MASAVPAGSIIQWDEVPDFRALLTHAQGTDAEIIYLAPSDVRDASPPTLVEAVAEFADPRVVPETPDRYRGRGTGPARLRRAIRLRRAVHPIALARGDTR